MAMPKIEQAALAAPYTQEQMLEVCRLVKGATSVELKLLARMLRVPIGARLG